MLLETKLYPLTKKAAMPDGSGTSLYNFYPIKTPNKKRSVFQKAKRVSYFEVINGKNEFKYFIWDRHHENTKEALLNTNQQQEERPPKKIKILIFSVRRGGRDIRMKNTTEQWKMLSVIQHDCLPSSMVSQTKTPKDRWTDIIEEQTPSHLLCIFFKCNLK